MAECDVDADRYSHWSGGRDFARHRRRSTEGHPYNLLSLNTNSFLKSTTGHFWMDLIYKEFKKIFSLLV